MLLDLTQKTRVPGPSLSGLPIGQRIFSVRLYPLPLFRSVIPKHLNL